MYELTTPPQMTSPYTPAGGSNMQPATPTNTPQPPKLGTPVPGTTGGLPAQPGLSVMSNPLSTSLQGAQQPQPVQSAQNVQQYGRGQDSMLVHMTPDEVNSLRGLAQQFGGDLSTNPHTGLPEAGILGKILPTVLGGIGMAFGIPPVWMGALGLAGGTAATGDLGKGLMMGLGAFGGASLAGGLGVAGKLGQVGASLGLPGASAIPGAAGAATNAAKAAMPSALSTPITGVAPAAPSLALTAPGQGVLTQAGMQAARAAAPQVVAPAAAQAAGGAGGGFMSNFAQSAQAGLPGGIAAKAAPVAAGLGLLGAMTPSVPSYKDKKKPSEYGYTGPYRVAGDRVMQNAPASPNAMGVTTTPEGRMTSAEQTYFKPNTSYVDSEGNPWTPGQKTTPLTNVGSSKNPRWVYNDQLDAYRQQQAAKNSPGGNGVRQVMEDAYARYQASPMAYAKGGELFDMESGGHVFPAKVVSAFGNFDTHAGQQRLAKMGGIPIQGAGDGVSDSIPARIDRNQPARVASGEVYFPPEAVKRLGGSKKLYAMMRNAERAANRTKSGDKVKGLGAL